MFELLGLPSPMYFLSRYQTEIKPLTSTVSLKTSYFKGFLLKDLIKLMSESKTYRYFVFKKKDFFHRNLLTNF